MIRNSQITFVKGYGYADIENDIPMDEDTVLQVASISKPVTAWGIMRLVEEGKIKLDDPIEKYIRRWRFPDSDYESKGVTVRRLLNHTAGLSVWGYPV